MKNIKSRKPKTQYSNISRIDKLPVDLKIQFMIIIIVKFLN